MLGSCPSAGQEVHSADKSVTAGTARGPAAAGAVLVSIVYLAAEAWFHFELLDAASSVHTSRETLERLADIGKVLAAFGLAWTARGRGGAARLCFLVAAFWGLLWCVHSALLAALPAQSRIEAWDLAAYRVAIAAGRVSDASVPRDVAGQGAALTNVALLAVADRGFAERAGRWRRAEAARAEREVTSAVERAWTEYGSAMVKLERGRAKFRAESRKALAPDLFRENRRIGFRNITGVSPDPDIGPDAFLRALASSKMEGREEARRWLASTLADLPDDRTIKGGDLPAGLSRKAFEQRVGGAVREAASFLFPFGAAVADHPESDLVATAVYVPPLAAAASMLGAVANVGMVLAMALKAVVRRRWAFAVGFSLPPLAFAVWLAAMPAVGGQGGLADVWSRLQGAQRAALSVRATFAAPAVAADRPFEPDR